MFERAIYMANTQLSVCFAYCSIPPNSWCILAVFCLVSRARTHTPWLTDFRFFLCSNSNWLSLVSCLSYCVADCIVSLLLRAFGDVLPLVVVSVIVFLHSFFVHDAVHGGYNRPCMCIVSPFKWSGKCFSGRLIFNHEHSINSTRFEWQYFAMIHSKSRPNSNEVMLVFFLIFFFKLIVCKIALVVERLGH